DKKYTFVSSKKQQSCSKECAYKLRGKRSSDTQSKKVIVCCEKCGRERMVSPTYSYRRFCSTACAHEFNSGERNPNWKGGITSERSSFDSSKEFKKARKMVWKRDNATCQKCGDRFNHSQRTFEVHHIIPFEYKKGRYDIENLVLVCNPCHNWIHSKRNKKNELIKPIPVN